MGIDFLAIGDAVVDDFIHLKDAEVLMDKGARELCVTFGDKVPFESSTKVYGVGNAANAAVAAARLGLRSGLVANIGHDQNGDLILKSYQKEKVDRKYVREQRGAPTNYHYVLWYGDERTILVNHYHYDYHWPNPPAPKTAYLSSLASGTEKYHDDIAAWLEKNPKIFFAFQPGTFQMEMGTDKLARLYQRADIVFANKEEYQRILKSSETDETKLLELMHALGPKICVLTDGPKGVTAREEAGAVTHLDMFPDPKPPVQRTGAGDAFASTTASYVTMGATLKDAMQRGLVNSAYVVQGVGAQTGLLTKKELESKLS